MFASVLIANRGEIAVRIARTCRRLGVRSIGVVSSVDTGTSHPDAVDECVVLGDDPVAGTYLSAERLVAAALAAGAEAVHPGYGFLSENADFAEQVMAAGLTWVGPSPASIRLLGDKAAAKAHMRAAGVPVVEGREHPDGLDDDAVAEAVAAIGLPVLVKAVAGGGGKGMRAVHDLADLAEAVAGARREARAAFGDDALLVEQLVVDPRHVEVQVVGDGRGNVVHLGERDCSVQRRHQKVVEETPSPALTPELRDEICAAAVRAAASVDYAGAGTVEFILGQDGRFAFLEMNTRLQVEHPVTELVTGVDLVAWQLEVAEHGRLPATQDEIVASGHAVEVRLYAEDPAVGFLPQTGPVAAWRPPTTADLPDGLRAAGAVVRVDDGLGAEVSRHYDPMVAKIVTHAPDRATAVAALDAALGATVLHGCRSNLGFLRDVLTHPAFVAGDEVTTAFIARHLPDWTEPAPSDTAIAAAAADLVAATPAAGPSPFATLGPFRLGGTGGQPVRLRRRDAAHLARVVASADGLRATCGEAVSGSGARRTTVVVDEGGTAVWLQDSGLPHVLEVDPPTRHADLAARAGDASFTAPMPGQVLRVAVVDEQEVTAGEVLVVVEAMKMEHAITAPTDGTVTRVRVAAGDAVDARTVLLDFAATGDAA